MVNVVNDLVTQGGTVQVDGHWELKGRLEDIEAGVPQSLQHMIEQQLERLGAEDQRLLEVASVAGAEFSAAAVAAGMETGVEATEEQCEELVRREHFLRASGTADWPDGTVAARYRFLHALYQEVLYYRLTARRRQRLHQQIGEREEQGYGEQVREIAAELALHFERGRDYRKAVRYLQQAGENAVRRSANQEAINLFTKGLELLKTLPDTPERIQQELMLQIALGVPLQVTKGYADPELERTYTRARELCQKVGETPQLFFVLEGMWAFYLMRAELDTARKLGEQLFSLAQSVQDPASFVRAHYALGQTFFWLGEMALARAHLGHCLAFYDRQQHLSYASRHGMDPRVGCLGYVVRALWFLGYPDQALKLSHKVLTLARELSHPFSLAYTLDFAAAWLHQLRREEQAAQEQAEAAIMLSTEQGFALTLAAGTLLRGWALAEQGQREEGIAQICRGMAAWRATGAETARTYWLARLAEAYGKVGQAEKGLNLLAEALDVVYRTGERISEAELYRLKGQLTLQSKTSLGQVQDKSKTGQGKSKIEKEAEEYFLKAIEIAHRQQAKSLELRAVMSLARLWQQQGKKKQAHKMLAEIYDWFTEGFDTKDLQEAKALLEELA